MLHTKQMKTWRACDKHSLQIWSRCATHVSPALWYVAGLRQIDVADEVQVLAYEPNWVHTRARTVSWRRQQALACLGDSIYGEVAAPAIGQREADGVRAARRRRSSA